MDFSNFPSYAPQILMSLSAAVTLRHKAFTKQLQVNNIKTPIERNEKCKEIVEKNLQELIHQSKVKMNNKLLQKVIFQLCFL